LIAVEILAIAVRAQENIGGIEINGVETNLLQFADDTTAAMEIFCNPKITQIIF